VFFKVSSLKYTAGDGGVAGVSPGEGVADNRRLGAQGEASPLE